LHPPLIYLVGWFLKPRNQEVSDEDRLRTRPAFEDSEFKEPYDAFRHAGNLVTSRRPSDIPAFIRESLNVLEHVLARL